MKDNNIIIIMFIGLFIGVILAIILYLKLRISQNRIIPENNFSLHV